MTCSSAAIACSYNLYLVLYIVEMSRYRHVCFHNISPLHACIVIRKAIFTSTTELERCVMQRDDLVPPCHLIIIFLRFFRLVLKL